MTPSDPAAAFDGADAAALITIDRYVQQLAFRSYVLNLPAAARGDALAHARDVAAAHAVAGEVVVGYRTTVLRARRLLSAGHGSGGPE
jgi:hypothetical protein